MRRRTCARAAALVGLALASQLGLPEPLTGPLGVSPAEAAGFYTRKRVNGRWVTGHFPKAGKAAVRSSRRSRAVIEEEEDVADVPVPPARERVLISANSSEPAPSQAVSAPAAGRSNAQVAALQPLADFAEERLFKLRRALQARADELAAAQAVTAEPVAVPAAFEPNRTSATLPKADQVPLTVLGAGQPSPERVPVATAAAAAPPGEVVGRERPPAPGPLEAKSVSYDFETGIKTTVFENSVVREPFDVAALKSMTGRLHP